MRDIAKLLFGDGASRALDLLAGRDSDIPGNDADGSGLAERARRSGEWCGTTPGHGRAADALGTASRARRDKSL